METITDTLTLVKDIHVFYITAKSFPDGILEAHQKLHAVVPFSKTRNYFGISRPENEGDIVYKAAAEEKEAEEAKKFGLETMTIRKGNYVFETIKNYTQDPGSIKKTFDRLLKEPGLDPEGYCVEWYINENDMKCMIRLQQ